MKALKLALIASAAVVAVAGFGSAASAETTVAYNAGIATDYIFRGIDQTGFAEDGEVFGGVDVASGPLYAGTWLSNTGPDADMGVEYDLYAGYKLPLGGATLDLGAIYYGYTDGEVALYSKGSNYELKAALSLPLGGATLGGQLYWTPDFFQTGKDGLYAEINLGYTMANKLTLSAAYGQQSFDFGVAGAPDDYKTWNIGATYPITDHLSIDARYIGVDTDIIPFAALVGAPMSKSRAVGTLKATF